jgi:DhnA family fructose-bisphosphate aldolase class Ia
VVKKYRDRLIGRIPTTLRLDGGPSLFRQDWLAYTEWSLLHSVDDALALGVNAVVLMAFVGIPVELETYRILGKVASQCYQANLPLLVEALPCLSERIPDARAPIAMAAAARIAFEHGADYVKTYYTGSPEGFRLVINNCPVPVLIAGGPRMDSVQSALHVVSAAVQAGAAGVVFGRNIWQDSNPASVVRALKRIIHDGATPLSVLDELATA